MRGTKIIIHGHGGLKFMREITKYARDYLKFMRGKIAEILDDDGALNEHTKSINQPTSILILMSCGATHYCSDFSGDGV